MPAVGARVPYLYLAFAAVEDDDPILFGGLLRHAYNALRTGPWHYAILGLHERDPLAAVFDDYRRIDAAGLLFAVDLESAGGDPLAWLDDRVPAFEMALA